MKKLTLFVAALMATMMSFATSISEVLAIGNALEDNKQTTELYDVTGEVVYVNINLSYGNADIVIKEGTDMLYCWRTNDEGNAKFTDANKVKVGDRITVRGAIKHYGSLDISKFYADYNSKIEMTYGYIVGEGSQGDEGDGDEEPETPVVPEGAVTFDGKIIGDQGAASPGALITKTVGTVTLSIDKGQCQLTGADGKPYDTPYIKAFAGSKMTISATENITKIVINTIAGDNGKDKYSASAFTATGYTAATAATVGTWTGNAKSVDFSATAQVRMISVIVTVGEGSVNPGDDETGDVIELQVNDGSASYYEEHSEEGAYNFTIDLVNRNEENLEELKVPYLSFDCFMPTAKSLVGTYSIANGTMGTEYSTAYLTQEEVDDIFAEGHAMTAAELVIKCIGQDEEGDYIYDVDAKFTSEGKQYHAAAQLYLLAYKQLDTDGDDYYDSEEPYEIVEVVKSAIHNLEVDNSVFAKAGRIYCEETARIYNVNGVEVTRMNGNLEGVYIVRNGNKLAKVIVTK